MPDPQTPDAQPFRLTTRPDGARVVLEAHGEMDLVTAPAVEDEVHELRSRGVGSIVLDLRALTFIDSSGLSLLLRLDAEARSDDFSFAIIEGEGPVRRLLELTNLSDDFLRAEP
jgi:anti-sigma B factor antagonist